MNPAPSLTAEQDARFCAAARAYTIEELDLYLLAPSIKHMARLVTGKTYRTKRAALDAIRAWQKEPAA